MSVLFSLPTALQVELFIKWLPLKAVTKLNTAACSKESKLSFKHVLEDPHCVFSAFGITRSSRFIEWVNARSIRLCSISMPSHYISSMQLRKFFALTGKYLETIDLHRNSNVSEILLDVSVKCPKLVTLLMKDADLKGVNLDAVLLSCRHLTYLGLQSTQNLSIKLLRRISLYGKHIRTIDCTQADLHDKHIGFENDSVHTIIAADAYGCINDFIHRCKGLRQVVTDFIRKSELFSILENNPYQHTVAIEMIVRESIFSDAEFELLLVHLKKITRLHLYTLQKRGFMGVFSEEQLLRVIKECVVLEVLWLGKGGSLGELLHPTIIHTAPHENSVYGESDDTDSDSTNTTITNATYLTHYTHTNTSTSSNTTISTTRTCNLRNLYMYTVSPTTLLQVIHICPHLTTLIVEDCSHWRDATQVSAVLQALHNSHIQCWELRGLSIKKQPVEQPLYRQYLISV